MLPQKASLPKFANGNVMFLQDEAEKKFDETQQRHQNETAALLCGTLLENQHQFSTWTLEVLRRNHLGILKVGKTCLESIPT